MGISRTRRRDARRIALVTAVAIGGTIGVGAQAAQAQLRVGIGDQKPQMFSDPRFAELGIQYVRRVVPWDALNVTWQRHELDVWMHAARGAGSQPLIAFGKSRRPHLASLLPTPARFARTFRKFRRRYPWVRLFTPWNEANQCGEPTCRHPRMAALYYNEMRARCPSCTVLAADVLDSPNMLPWLTEFRRFADGDPQLWGLHNYFDANRFRATGTERLLATVPGEVWFTEVGGLVRRRAPGEKPIGPQSPQHAARVTAWLFRLAELSPRIRRLYLYQWNGERGRNVNWDSGLISPKGRPRPAFRVLLRELRRLRLIPAPPRG